MFDSTRRRYDELNDFLAKRNILDENDTFFALNKTSNNLKSGCFKDNLNFPQPLFLLSFIPKFPNNEIIKSQDNIFDNWIKSNSSGYISHSNGSLFSTYKKTLNISGTIYKHHLGLSYIEFQNNGYVEAGLCDAVYHKWPDDKNKTFYGMNITNCVGYIMSQLRFAKKYYDYINYDDEIILQISFRNVLNFIPVGFNQIKGQRNWRRYDDAPKNETDNCFKVLEKFIPSSLDETKITEIGMRMAEKILFAFNVDDTTVCFIDGKIDENLYKEIDSI
jgi:hypothetical protein